MEVQYYNIFDTVEIQYPKEVYLHMEDFDSHKRGYLLSYVWNDSFFDDVVIGFYKEAKPFKCGSYVKINTCRMVLIEKFDSKLMSMKNSYFW